jgi:hypothetical protein
MPADGDGRALLESHPDETDGLFAVRWRAARERWAQLTFYLFDPDGWR